MKRTVKLLSCVFCCALIFLASFSVLAVEESVDLKDFSGEITLPEGSYVLYPDFSVEDEMWSEAGISNPEQKLEIIGKTEAVALISASDGDINIYVGESTTDSTKAIYNLQSMSEEELAEFVNSYNTTTSDYHVQASSFVVSNIPFVEISFSGTDDVGQSIYETVIFTVINGSAISFSQNSDKIISEESTAFLKGIISNIEFPEIMENPNASAEKPEGQLLEAIELGMNLYLPESAIAFNHQIAADDPLWAEAGIEDNTEMVALLDVVPVQQADGSTSEPYEYIISDNNNEINLYVNKKTTEMTMSYFDLKQLSDEEMTEFLTQYNMEEDTAVMTGEVYMKGEQPFIIVNLKAQTTTGELVYENLIFTIINGSSITFSQHSEAEITQEELDYTLAVVDNLEINAVDSVRGLFGSLHIADSMRPIVDISTDTNTATPMTEEEFQQAIISLSLFGLMLLILIGAIVYIKVSSSKRRKAETILAANLANYRFDREEGFEKTQEILFTNSTEVTDSAIDKYSFFQSYVYNPLPFVASLVVTGLCIAFSIYTQSEWWVILLFLAAFGYAGYKFATSSISISKVMKRVYSKINNRTALYHFYEKEIQICGIESNEFHPYFQITELAQYKDYIFFYFGENNPYFVKVDGFTKGELAEFKAFISKKARKKFK